jgi:hypothetical protein
VYFIDDWHCQSLGSVIANASQSILNSILRILRSFAAKMAHASLESDAGAEESADTTA